MQKQVGVKYVYDDVLPVAYAREGDAGIDLRASGRWVVDLDDEKFELVRDEYRLQSGERIGVRTGIIMEIPMGCWGNIRDRSGLALKHGLHTLGGVIDETYRGEIIVVLVNSGAKEYVLRKHERVAQIIIQSYERVRIEKVEVVSATERGEGNFGSSGTH